MSWSGRLRGLCLRRPRPGAALHRPTPDGDIVLLSDEEDPQLRWRFTDITADSFTWRAELSATAAPPGTSTSKCRRRELTAPPSIITYAWMYKRYRSDRRSSAPRPPASRAWCFQDTVLFHASIRSVLACRFEQQSARPSRPDKGRDSNQHRSSTMTQQASWRQRRIEHGVPVCPCRAPFCTSSKPAAIRSAADRPEPANLRPATGHNSMTRSRADSAIRNSARRHSDQAQ